MLKLIAGYVLSIIMLLSIASCKRTPCSKADLTFGLISFTEAEADTIVYRRFVKSTGFAMLVDSLICDIRYSKRNDTLSWTYATANAIMSSDYDYKLYFPGAGKVYSVTEITEDEREAKHSFLSNVKIGCINNITSLKIDGVAVTLPATNYFYLKK